jgi:glycosyltransferase involved in cell wall biosynthesis/FMN phosphatase YigB (HAD superfamily)
MNTHPHENLPADLWQREESLRRAGELLDLGASTFRAVSFDFFDTLVWRITARPTDVFWEIGHRLAQSGALPNHITPRDFEVLRRIAEGKVRERQVVKDKTREDITLAEICEQLRAVQSDASKLAQTELAAENDLCLLNPSTMSFARHAKSRGLKVIITSDIYLAPDHLRDILRANGVDPAFFDRIYTSSDVGVCKGTGNLFRHVLRQLNLQPAQVLHIGDNAHPDVMGARKAGVRGCHYPLANPDGWTLLDRERVLLGGHSPSFSVNSLRLLAARHATGTAEEIFFGRAGSLLLGPLLARFATWACEQFVAAGVRHVGAFMREGELLGQLLQREAQAMGHPLEITPLFVNRKSTDLAAIGRLTADNLIDWLERRQTLPVKTILEHFGLRASELRNLPFDPDEVIRTSERILKFAKYLFTPDIARRIEARSAEERAKVLDYLQPWIAAGSPFGVCDIGYNASAQLQLKKIFELEKSDARMVGCYLVTCERAAQRLLDGLDVRHFLGAFGRPDFHYFAFLRSPAFVEQSLVAPIGTTLGYERRADGSVHPVLDDVRFPDELMRRQRAFKEGVLHYQRLWQWQRAERPGLLDGTTELSRRILAETDAGCAPILARAAAFPLQSELAHFGAIPLDDYYFAEKVKTICGPKEQELLRKKGYNGILVEQGVLWPQAVHQMEHPRSNIDFFSYAKRMLLCTSEGDHDGVHPDLSVIVATHRDPTALRDCLQTLKAVSNRNLRYDVVLLTLKDDKTLAPVASEFVRDIPRLRLQEARADQPISEQVNAIVDASGAPYFLITDDTARFAAGWDIPLVAAIEASPKIGAVQPHRFGAEETPRALFVRRLPFIEALGLREPLTLAGGLLDLLFGIHSLQWEIAATPDPALEFAGRQGGRLPSADAAWLSRRWPEFKQSAARLVPPPSGSPSADVPVDWVGTFLDHGSLSHVNRELTAALQSQRGIQLRRVATTPPQARTAGAWQDLARSIQSQPSEKAIVSVRHAWPPDWQRPAQGALVVMQPWEFGILPESWVHDLRRADECWVYTECVRRMYLDSGVPSHKVHVVPLGIDPGRFRPEAQPKALNTTKRFRFLFVGGTIHRKGPDVLLKAYLEAFTASDDVCLVIKDFGGKGVYEGQTFEARIRAAQAQPNAPEILHLDTELSPEELPGLYTACHCLVHPYRGEGFGLPVLEAMACGLPVIVTAGGATDDFATPDLARLIPSTRSQIGTQVGPFTLAQTGWLLEPSQESVASEMRRAYDEPAEARALGQKASAHVRLNWTWDRAAALAAVRIHHLAQTLEQERSRTAARRGRASAPIVLPDCARLGRLDEARALLKQNHLAEAWASAISALQERPFHPEGVLLLGEIAGAAGEPARPRQLLERAARMAPRWKPAQQALRSHRPAKGPARVPLSDIPEHLRSGHSPRLTVCLITRNEESFLDAALASVKGLASQIVVVDTGSTDRTIEIARSHGAEVHALPWNDDFSAARNAALSYARGDWVLVLDADEELPPAQHEALREHMRDASAIAFRIPILDVGHEDEGCHHVPRLFRNAPGLFYVGRIHEQVFSSVEVRRAEWGLENRIGKTQLLHHGYQKEVVRSRDKTARNLRLLQMAVDDYPEDANLVMNLGLETIRSGRLGAGLDHYFEAFQFLSSQPSARIVPELRENLLTQLPSHLLTARRHEDIVKVLTSPLAKSGGGLTATHHFLLGLALMELRQYSEAIAQMRECLSKRTRSTLTPIHKDVRKAGPQHCIAMCAVALKQVDVAEQAFHAAAQDDPRARTVRFDFARFLASQNQPIPALQWLHQLVRENNQDVAAWELGAKLALSEADFLEVARDWTAEACQHLPAHPALALYRAEALLLSGDAEMALALWKEHGRMNLATHAAATLVCEAALGHPVHPPAPQQATAISQEFLKWCQRLMKSGATDVFSGITTHLDRWESALPAAAQALRAALVEAEAPMLASDQAASG